MSGKAALAKATLPGVLLCALLVPFFHARGGQAAMPGGTGDPVASAQTAEQRFRETQTFASLGRKTALVLRGDKAKSAVSFVLPGTKIVDAADLAIRYQASAATGEDTVETAVFLNDIEINTITVPRGSSTPDVAHISLPADLLVHDNTLSFELRRQCVSPCRQGNDGSWLRIEPTSELDTSGAVLRLPNRLSMLPAPFFDPSVHRSIDVPFAFDAQPDLPSLKAAGVLASWYGAMAGYRSSHFVVSVGQLPKGNVILLAHADSALAASLGLTGVDAQITICDNPSDRYGKVLALVANSSSNLVRLAQFVARHRFADDSDRMSLTAERLVDQPPAPNSPSWFETTQPLSITGDLNENLLHAKIDSPTRLYFRIAPDLDYGTNVSVPLHLCFRLSGLTGDDHTWISIRLNNDFVAKRRLSSADTGDSHTQSFAIPVSMLYPSNTLEIELGMNRADTRVSEPGAVDLQVLPATNIDLKNPAHVMRMPRLDLFAASGYPFTSKADGSETAVLVPEDSSAAQIGLFLDAMGFLSAQTGVGAANFNVINASGIGTERDRNLLVIGSSNNESMFRRFEGSMVVVPTHGRFEMGASSLPWQEWLSRAWLGRREETQKLLNLLEIEGGPKFLLQQFISPFRQDRSMLILATRSETDDQPYFDRIAEASREGLINGGVSIADGSRFTSFRLNSRSYVLGPRRSLAAIYGWLQFHLWILPVFLICAAMVVARWWELLLARQAQLRLEVIP